MQRYEIYYNDVIDKVRNDERYKGLTTKDFVDIENAAITQLDYCQAWVISTPYFEILQSYNTLVACIDNDGFIYCSGTYSATTRRHIGRFAELFGLTYQDFKNKINN